MKPVKDINDPRWVKAIGHPLRVRIMAMLRERDASPAELSELLGASLGTVAYHVRTLEQLGVIELVKETRVRGAIEHHYRALMQPIITDEAWGKASSIVKQAAVGAQLDVIDEYVRASAAAGGFDRSDAHTTRWSLELDAKGFAQLAAACEKLYKQLQTIEQAAAKRIARDPHADDIVDVGMAVLLFEAVKLSDPNRVTADGQRRRTKAKAKGSRKPPPPA